MKEIKAYIRPQFVDSVVEALEKAGARDLTVIRVDAFGPLADAESEPRRFVHKYAEKYSAVVKVEVVCREENAGRFMKIIREHAYTGQHGDGRIFSTKVDEALNIRTGETGSQAL